jgi:hypothetical protein
MMLVKVREIQDHLQFIKEVSLQLEMLLASGINPPCSIPKRARQSKKVFLPFK